MQDQVLTLEEAADRAKVKVKSMREWLRTGKLKGIKAGRLWRVRASDLEAFFEASAQRPRLVREPDDAEAAGAQPLAQAQGPAEPVEEGKRKELTGDRARIADVLRAHPEGLTPAQVQAQLGTDKPLRDTMKNMLQDGILRRPHTAAYAVYVLAEGS
jgi:excisionase family DNA binding protein